MPSPLRKLPKCVLMMVMDYYGRAPFGIPNDVYYQSDGRNKVWIDAASGHLESIEIVSGSVMYHVYLKLKREATTMVSLMHARVPVEMVFGDRLYGDCFVEAVAQKGTSIKISNYRWRGKWVKIDALRWVELRCVASRSSPRFFW